MGPDGGQLIREKLSYFLLIGENKAKKILKKREKMGLLKNMKTDIKKGFRKNSFFKEKAKSKKNQN